MSTLANVSIRYSLENKTTTKRNETKQNKFSQMFSDRFQITETITLCALAYECDSSMLTCAQYFYCSANVDVVVDHVCLYHIFAQRKARSIPSYSPLESCERWARICVRLCDGIHVYILSVYIASFYDIVSLFNLIVFFLSVKFE